jgi:hypothetical protein
MFGRTLLRNLRPVVAASALAAGAGMGMHSPAQSIEAHCASARVTIGDKLQQMDSRLSQVRPLFVLFVSTVTRLAPCLQGRKFVERSLTSGDQQNQLRQVLTEI